MVQVKQDKLNYTSMVNTPEGAAMLTGIFFIRGFSVKVLFDSGATHSFINEKILNKLGLKSCHMNRSFLITTLGGRVTTGKLLMRVPLELGSKIAPANLLALSLEGIDVILGMDWLT
jgi:predicted aspartyl protease